MSLGINKVTGISALSPGSPNYQVKQRSIYTELTARGFAEVVGQTNQIEQISKIQS